MKTFSENGMPESNFCNGSETQFSSPYHVLPGGNVTITCSIPDRFTLWESPGFFETLYLAAYGFVQTHTERLDGAITFDLIQEIFYPDNSSCLTSTATLTNIQESMQGMRLRCYNFYTIQSTVVIDVVGKLLCSAKNEFKLLLCHLLLTISCYAIVGLISSKWIGQPPAVNEYSVLVLLVHVKNYSHVF